MRSDGRMEPKDAFVGCRVDSWSCYEDAATGVIVAVEDDPEQVLVHWDWSNTETWTACHYLAKSDPDQKPPQEGQNVNPSRAMGPTMTASPVPTADPRWTGHVDFDGPRWYDAPDLIGKEVIAQSNEDDPPLVGTLVRYESLAHCHHPVVRAPDGKEYYVLGLLLPAHQEFVDFINLHGGKKAFYLLRDMRWLWLHADRQVKSLDAEIRQDAMIPQAATPATPHKRPWWRLWGSVAR